jgi:hypothetical protein
MRAGNIPGVVFDDFVFEITPTDFGDAPLTHTTRLLDQGPRHLNTNLEWLGQGNAENVESVSPEPDAQDSRAIDADLPDATIDPDGVENVDARLGPDRDRFDDGVVFFRDTYRPGKTAALQFTPCAADPASGRYGPSAERSQWVNGWIDWDGDGAWEDGERVAKSVQIDPAGPWTLVNPQPAIRRVAILPGGTCAVFEAQFVVPAALGPGDVWSRFRIDLGENLDPLHTNALFDADPSLDLAAGAARFGEVEDYRLLEVDEFPLSLGRFTIEGPLGSNRILMQGPTTILVDLLGIGDPDGDGREGVTAEMIRLDLTGSSPFGPMRLRIRDPAKHPFQRSLGRIDEQSNATAGGLDLPPFAASGRADSYFDVYFEVEVAGMLLHNKEPKRMSAEISVKPPRERYEGPTFLTLYDESNAPTQFRVGGASHIPDLEEVDLEILLGDLRSASVETVIEAIDTLRRLGDRAAGALPALQVLADHSDAAVRQAAAALAAELAAH